MKAIKDYKYIFYINCLHEGKTFNWETRLLVDYKTHNAIDMRVKSKDFKLNDECVEDVKNFIDKNGISKFTIKT